jgi:flagellar M-ring protein FliF
MAEEIVPTFSRKQIAFTTVATIIVAIVVFFIWYILIRMPYAPAFTDINSNDAVTITQELDRIKTPYELDDNGATILVPEDQVDAARIAILGGELPLKGAVGFELFNNTDIGLTEFAQKINYQRALQGELARTIMGLEEIETARVHLSLPESGIFEQDRRPAKASITIATKLGGEIEPAVVLGVQQLVAAAVPELVATNVAILNAQGQLLSAAPAVADVAIATPEQIRRADYEQHIATQIEDAIRGAGISLPMKIKVTALRRFDDATRSALDVENPDAAPVTGERFDTPRNDPVDVRITFGSLPSEALRQKIMGVTRTAMNFNEAIGDNIALIADPSAAIADVVKLGPSAAKGKTNDASLEWNAPGLPWWPFILGILVCSLAILFWIGRTIQARPMKKEDRIAFADRLKMLLDEEDRIGVKSS